MAGPDHERPGSSTGLLCCPLRDDFTSCAGSSRGPQMAVTVGGVTFRPSRHPRFGPLLRAGKTFLEASCLSGQKWVPCFSLNQSQVREWDCLDQRPQGVTSICCPRCEFRCQDITGALLARRRERTGVRGGVGILVSRPQIRAAFHCTVASVRPPPAAPLVRKSGRWPALFSASCSEWWTVGRGRELRAPGNSIPTGEPLGQEIPWWVGLLGRRDAPPPLRRGEISFCLFSQASFSRNTGIWLRMVRGPCLGGVCALAFGVVVVFFSTGSSAQLVRRALRLESKVLPWHPEKIQLFPVVPPGISYREGMGELSSKPRSELCRSLN